MDINNLDDYVIFDTALLIDAINKINKNLLQAVFVTNQSSKLLSIITDGDLRRMQLNSIDLHTQLSDLELAFPLFLHTGASLQNCKDYVLEKNIKHLPILNKHGNLANIYFEGNFILPQLANTVFIQAGGKGIRLRPLTEDTPKPMLKIRGKPILQLLIEYLKNQGFNDFVITVNYLKEVIINHFGDGSSLGVKIRYCEEDHDLGTAGALSLIKDSISYPILSINGDLITSFDLSELINHMKKIEADGVIVSKKIITQIPFGVIESNQGFMTSIDEKPEIFSNIAVGIYLLDEKIHQSMLFNEKIDMPDLLTSVIKKGGRISIFVQEADWEDIGTLSALNKAKNL